MPTVEDIRHIRLLLCQASCAYAEGDQGRGDELVLQLMSMTLPWTFDRENARARPSRTRRAVVCR